MFCAANWWPYRRQEDVPDRDSMFAGFIGISTFPEGIVLLPQRSASGKPSFLQGCDADIKFQELLVNDGRFSGICDLL